MGKRWRVCFVLLGIALASASRAVPVKGAFFADQVCPAYVSIKKQTNPGDIYTAIGQSYRTLEANKPEHPAWYRIGIPAANPKERWVNVACGTFRPDESPSGPCCSIAGQADSYVLALSWQPAFCELKPATPECSAYDQTFSYQAGYFTLHGLWPNKVSCGTGYGFCGEIEGRRDFCNYPAIALTAATRANLARVMPSVEANSCLERHEWYKHGTCQTTWSADGYFDVAVKLTDQFNESGIGEFMKQHRGQQVRTADFMDRLDTMLGPAARYHIKLSCNQGMLTEIQVSLPTGFGSDANLRTLLAQAPMMMEGSSCPSQFKIDAME